MLTKNISNNQLFRLAILAYWSLFWFFNSLDKVFGGSSFMWVGRDRFAQFQKFFASAGLESPIVANIGLIFAAALEIFAFVFFVGAFIHFIKQKQAEARTWFFVGIVLTLITFTLFSVGDHIFGDRFELLEHTLFWFVTLFSWVVFIRLDKLGEGEKVRISGKQVWLTTVIIGLLVLTTSVSIFQYSDHYFFQRSKAVAAEQINDDMYKFSFPFLGGSTVFENSLDEFKKEHPEKRINHIYTAPNELRLQKADGLIFYVLTENK